MNSFFAQCAQSLFLLLTPTEACVLPIVAITIVINGVTCRITQIYYVIGALFLSVCSFSFGLSFFSLTPQFWDRDMPH